MKRKIMLKLIIALPYLFNAFAYLVDYLNQHIQYRTRRVLIKHGFMQIKKPEIN